MDQGEKLQQAIDLLSSITHSTSLGLGCSSSRVGGGDREEPGPSRGMLDGGMLVHRLYVFS